MNTATAQNNQINKRFVYDYYDEDAISSAKEVFAVYQKNGVIKNTCSFDDNTWYATDERTNTSLSFAVDVFTLNRLGELLNKNPAKIITGLKVFVLCNMNRLLLQSIQTFLNEMRHNIFKAVCAESEDSLSIRFHGFVVDFLSSLQSRDGSDADERISGIIENIYRQAVASKSSKQRTLSTFDSYLLFYKIIMDYWGHDLPKEERLFYYPLYLWVRIAWVIPTRPIEFILTKRDCLRISDGDYYLTLRKSKLKGCGKEISHKIASDFMEMELRIPEAIGKDIQEYIDFTKDMFRTELDTLFVTVPHYMQVWKSDTYDRKKFRYLTYTNMCTILRWFYDDIISSRYGYSVVYDEEMTINNLPDHSIEFIHLGDIRHIALFNIVESGSLLSAMILAGHNDINITSHYYTNISTIVECNILRAHRKLIHGSEEYSISEYKNTLMNPESYVRLSGDGYCVSKKYAEHNYEDCYNACGPNGEIGRHEDCPFYREDMDFLLPSDKRFREENARYKEAIDNDAEFLRQAVEKVRKGKGYDEDIVHAVQRLEKHASAYKQFRLSQVDNNEKGR